MRYHGDISNAYAELLNLFNKSRSDLETLFKHQLEKIGELQHDFSGAAQDICGHIGSASQKLYSATSAFGEAGERFVRSGEEVRQQVSSSFEWLTRTLDETLKDYRRELGHIEEHLRELMERLDPRLLPRDEWAVVRDAFKAYVSSLEGCKVAMERCCEELSNISGGDGNVPASELQDTIIKDLQQVVERLNQTVPAFEKFQDSVISLQKVVGSLDHTVNGFNQSIIEVQKVVGSLNQIGKGSNQPQQTKSS